MKSYRRYILFSVIASFLLWGFAIFAENSFAATNGEGYCQVPPYVIQNTPPSIMVVVDISGSMYNFAYSDGFETVAIADDNLCTGSGSPCTGFANPGAYPTYKYYGYYDPDYWYTYGSNRFTPTAPKTGSGLSGARAKNSNEWDGNFLNWLTMRRTDILRKVLTGGLVSSAGGTYSRLRGEEADDITVRGGYKQIANIENYANSTVVGTGTKCITFSDGASSPSQFIVRNTSSCTSGTIATYDVEVDALNPIEGVLQSLVSTKARLGLTFYKPNTSGLTHATDQGGRVQTSISGTSLSAIVNQVNNTDPSTNTPLGETLWTVVGYYAQQSSMLSGPGPRYASGDYTINNLNDPFNYGTSGQPRWPTCAKGYVLYITDGEPCSDGRLPASLSDYAGTAGSQYNCTGTSCPAVGTFAASTFPSCGANGNVAGIEDVALYAHTTDLRAGINDTQNLTIFPVFAFGKGSTLLRYTAINGGFKDTNSNNLPDLQSEWDSNGDGEPDNFYEATDGYELEQALKNAFSTMLERASSGTAASVLASGEGSGANLIQAVFYPRRRVGNDVITWAGAVQNIWYYLDPFYSLSSLREDTVQDKILHTINDYIVELYFDYNAQETRASRCQDVNGNSNPDDNSDGVCDSPQSTVSFENLHNLWEAGMLLWSRDIATDTRTIYTTLDGSSLIYFSTANASTLRPYFDLPASGDTNLDGFIDGDINHDASVNDIDAEYLIRYVNGEDGAVVDLNSDGIPEYRSRTVTLGADTYVWKLGDILNSTPKILSKVPLNSYDVKGYYEDKIYERFISLSTQQNIWDGVDLGTIDGYQRRKMIFVGGNDGMLHAFKLGSLEWTWSGQTLSQKARLTGTDLGKEMWAFMPKNVLPYLKYVMDPEYCHVYSVDLTPYLLDVSISKPVGCSSANYWDCTKTVESWRTILIGGMRLGGACRKKGTACNNDGVSTTDCVNTPALDPVDNTKGLGYSSYFALDITDQYNPRLLWEFSHEDLGFTSTSASVVKIGARKPDGSVDASKNGKWFVIFGSGPTGAISTGDGQFLGRSDQNLKLFIFDLKEGPGVNNANVVVKNTGIQYAFASSMFDSARDFVQSPADYQDDAAYVGYTRKCTSTTGVCTNNTWTNGGIVRLVTKKTALNTTPLDPTNWVTSTVIDGVGPVTASIRSADEKTGCSTFGCANWLFFGTGRYFYVQGTDVDDPDKIRTLFGFKDPCYLSTGQYDPTCTASGSFCTTPCSNSPTCTGPANCGDFLNVTDVSNAKDHDDTHDPTYRGWYLNMDAVGNYTYLEQSVNVTRGYKTERIITDPAVSEEGCVYFVSFKPYSDECSIGGKSFLWDLWYSNGKKGGCKGVAVIQTSTGSIENVVMDNAGGRKTEAFEGVPPIGPGLTLFGGGQRLNKIVHIKER